MIFRPVKKLLRAVAPLFVAFLVTGCRSSLEMGNEALRIGDFERAIAKFSEVLDNSPADREARYGMALAYFGKAEAAEKVGEHSTRLWMRTLAEFRILAKIDSSVARKMHSTALFYLARAKTIENPKARILGILDESLNLDSTNSFSWNLKALALQGEGDDASAEKIFTFLLSKYPDFSPAYSNLGNLYWEKGNVEEAWDIWSMGALRFPQNRHLAYWTKVAEDSLKAKALKIGENVP
jgi:tetratricopeptide (TPR) repeat protein